MKYGDITNCRRCFRELEVNDENYMLGEEAFIVGNYSVWMDAKEAKDYDFVCRRCVLELTQQALVAEWERLNAIG